MELQNRFEVPVGIAQAWSHLLNMEEVAACFPGATLTSADGEEYVGTVKVKLGPIQLTYKGSARIVSADQDAHQATIEASGTAARSGSTASMTVVATASSLADDRTAVDMKTDLTITGRPAQFGRGVMAEVGNKILGKFADCMADKLAAGSAGDADSGSAAPAEKAKDDGDDESRHSPPSTSTGPAAAATYTRAPAAAQDMSEPIDLLGSARGSLVKRLIPVAAGAVGFFVLRWIVRRRGAANRGD